MTSEAIMPSQKGSRESEFSSPLPATYSIMGHDEDKKTTNPYI